MKKLAKYLKPFIWGVLLSIAFLFLQAFSELSLPNYMSEIVNIGIQQGGLETAAPEAISEDGMQLVKALLTDADKALLSAGYAHVQKQGAYTAQYPSAGEEFYVRTDDDPAIDVAFGRAVITLSSVAERFDNKPEEDFDITAIYPMLSTIEALPDAIIAPARESAAKMDESALIQVGIQFSKAFLRELGVDLFAIQRAYVLRIGLFMLLIALGGGVASVCIGFFSARVAAGVAKNLRRDLFTKIEGFSSDEFDAFSTASLITRCTNDITQVQMLLMMGLRMICFAPIMGIGGVIMALNKAVSMGWIILVACLVLFGVIMVVMSLALPRFKIIQSLLDKLNRVARENLSGLMVIRAFGTEAHERTRFDAASEDLRRVNVFIGRVMSFMFPAMMLIMNGISILIIWVGAHQIAASTIQVGDMMAFIQYAMQIIMSFLMISMIFVFVPRAAVSADRIAEVLEKDISIKDPDQPLTFGGEVKGRVEFKNVCFRYRGAEEDALHDISFIAEPGKTTAIIGSTGSGKSTIANLLVRMYDVTGGEIQLDGLDIRTVRQKDLRARIGYVPQKGVLLTGTIASNLRYGSESVTDADLSRAAQIAQATDFVNEREDGFGAEIAQGGANVSGGQKQRLSIARALAKKPEVFIFDDSFSALDFKTDAALRAALKAETTTSAVIVVAQRVSTILSADRIIVLEKGRIAGSGTHAELLSTCPEYYEIASSQLSKEELS